MVFLSLSEQQLLGKTVIYPVVCALFMVADKGKPSPWRDPANRLAGYNQYFNDHVTEHVLSRKFSKQVVHVGW